MAKISLQEYADLVLAEQYRQPLKTLAEAIAAIGWKPLEDADEYFPECCGQKGEIFSFLGSAYAAHCKSCGKFIHDITGPSFGNSWVNLIDSEKVQIHEDGPRWIAGVRVVEVA